MIVRCVCSHEWQDRLHGPQNRVANEFKGPGGRTMYRCTVCKREHTTGVGRRKDD